MATVPANRIAVKYHLSSAQSPIVNTAILGAVAKVLNLVSLKSLIGAIKSSVPAHADNNAAAAEEAFQEVSEVVHL